MHSLGTFLITRSNTSQHPPQSSNLFDSLSNILRKGGSNPSPNNVCHFRTIAIGADHNLQRTITVLTAKVEITLWRHIGNVCVDSLLLAQFPDLRGSFWIVDGSHDHVDFGIVQVLGYKLAVDVLDFALGYAVCDFIIETIAGADDFDSGVGAEEFNYTTCSYLCGLECQLSMSVR